MMQICLKIKTSRIKYAACSYRKLNLQRINIQGSAEEYQHPEGQSDAAG